MGSSSTAKRSDSEALVIGWRVARDLELEWFDKGKQVSHGDQPLHVLEGIDLDAVAMHTAIVAQSGSGKSFFLGRYLEEVLLRTRAQVSIFDPNADFRQFANTDDKVWKRHENGKVCEEWHPCGPKRDPLPHEKTAEEFKTPWQAIRKRTTGHFTRSAEETLRMAKLHWPSLRASFLMVGETVVEDPAGFTALHEYVRLAHELWESWHDDKPGDAPAFPTTLDELIDGAKSGVGKNNDELAKAIIRDLKAKVKPGKSIAKDPAAAEALESSVSVAFSRAAGVVTDSTRQYYKRRHRELEQLGRLAATRSEMVDAFGLSYEICDCRVLDMPSFEDPADRDTAVLFLLDAVWYAARSRWEEATRNKECNEARVPHLIVLDEAHNLVPADKPAQQVRAEIRERIKTIAGEGRKYGLFLVLVTQRPDKLDPQVLSECGNQALMLVRSVAVLDDCRKLLGVQIGDEDACTILRDFRCGYVRLSGKWSPQPRIVFTAARRTVTGGADLKDSWKTRRPAVDSVLKELKASVRTDEAEKLKQELQGNPDGVSKKSGGEDGE